MTCSMFVAGLFLVLVYLPGIKAPAIPIALSTSKKNTSPAIVGKSFSIKIDSFSLGDSSSDVTITSKSLKCGVGKTVGSIMFLVPLATYSFSSRKLTINSGSYKPRIYIDNKMTMEVKNVRFDDHGDKFFCELNVTGKIGKNNRNEHKRGNIYKINVEGKPTLVSPLPAVKYSPIENSSLKLSCSFRGYPTMSVQWSWSSGVQPNNNIKTTPTGTVPITVKSVLQLSKLKRTHSANYVCKGTNKHGSTQRTINVDVIYPPKISDSTKLVHRVCTGDQIVLSCAASGNPEPDVKLLRNGSLLEDSKEDLEFVVNVTNKQLGKYSCVATNAQGSATADVRVVSKDLDKKPPKISTSVSRDSMIVKWKNVRCMINRWNRTFVLYLKSDSGQRESKVVHCNTPDCSHVFDKLTIGRQYSVAASSFADDGLLTGRSSAVFTNITTPEAKKDSSSFPVAAVIGVVAGAIAVVAVVLIFCCCCKKRKESDANSVTKKLEVMKKSSIISDQMYEELTETRYVMPGKESESVYEALRPSSLQHKGATGCNTLEVDPAQLTIVKQVHNGSFWKVHKATFLNSKDKHAAARWEVAVKEWKGTMTAPERKELCSKLQLMMSLSNHPNILSVLGAITINDPLRTVEEYAHHGDLLQFLRKTRGMDDDYYNVNIKPKSYLKEQDLTQFAAEIANGMDYLSSNKVVHSMLMATCVMVVAHGERKVCKISDYASIKNIDKTSKERSVKQERSHLKWTAIEVLSGSTPTVESDIWSLGVVLYEVFTIGGVPYVNVPALTMLEVLKAGTRAERPDYIDNSIFDKISSCWQNDPMDRPSCADLKEFFEANFESKVEDNNEKMEIPEIPSSSEPPVPVYDDIEQKDEYQGDHSVGTPPDPYDDIGEFGSNKKNESEMLADDFYIDVRGDPD